MSYRSAGVKTRTAGSIGCALLTISAVAVFALVFVTIPDASASASAQRTSSNKAPGTLLATEADPGASSQDLFGKSAIAGNTAVIGAPGTDSDEGSVYIYEKGTSGWPTTPAATLTDPAASIDDQFGLSVAVSATGTTVIVGAPYTNDHEGSVYIYVKGKSGWPSTPTKTLTDPAAMADDEFGYSVAVSRITAMTLVVGSPGMNGFNGIAYIYQRGVSGWPKHPTATLSDPASNGAESTDYFGYSVAVSGKTVVVGSPLYSTVGFGGVTYLYVNSGSGWPTTPSVTLPDPGGNDLDHFGYSVSVAGQDLFVGDPLANSAVGAAYVFVRDSSGWSMTPTTTLATPQGANRFGYSVSVTDGVAAVGAPLTSSQDGSAYFYDESGSSWPTAPSGTVSDPGASTFDDFGGSVAVSGTTALVGAEGTDSDTGVDYIYKA